MGRSNGRGYLTRNITKQLSNNYGRVTEGELRIYTNNRNHREKIDVLKGEKWVNRGWVWEGGQDKGETCTGISGKAGRWAGN